MRYGLPFCASIRSAMPERTSAIWRLVTFGRTSGSSSIPGSAGCVGRLLPLLCLVGKICIVWVSCMMLIWSVPPFFYGRILLYSLYLLILSDRQKHGKNRALVYKLH